ncbi:LysR family transcriptional regulator [Marinomonas sp.]|jgi:DNA-binding transcriptional LysR family regulator|uniref:LysR family transcriptional regulator n=2 Tax=Marinomonas TaxID=28253 RepID=UPI003A933B65
MKTIYSNLQRNLSDIPAFVQVVETKSMSLAAIQLGVSKSTISKSITRLEETLKLRLLERNSRNIWVTAEGQTLYRHACQILQLVNETDSAITGLQSEPTGRVRVAMPMAFCRELLAPNLSTFQKAYPKIQLDIMMNGHSLDIFHYEIDIAVIVGELENSELIAMPLYSGTLKWVTTPTYLAQQDTPITLDTLTNHIRLCETRYGIDRFPVHQNTQRSHLDLQTNISHCNDPLTVREALLTGGGVSLLPEQYCLKHLQTGQLVEILQDIQPETGAAKLTALYPSRKNRSQRVDVVLKFLKELCQSLGT